MKASKIESLQILFSEVIMLKYYASSIIYKKYVWATISVKIGAF